MHAQLRVRVYATTVHMKASLDLILFTSKIEKGFVLLMKVDT